MIAFIMYVVREHGRVVFESRDLAACYEKYPIAATVDLAQETMSGIRIDLVQIRKELRWIAELCIIESGAIFKMIIKSDKLCKVTLKLTYRDINNLRAIIAEGERLNIRAGYNDFASAAERALNQLQEQYPVDHKF